MLLTERVQSLLGNHHMPFCPECGKNVGISQKFCRSCGASLIEESPAVAAPPPPPGPNLRCLSCGALLAPDEKFCGSCGAKSGQVVAPAAAAPAPAPVAVPVPAPVYQAPPPHVAPRPAALVCTSCGSPMTPDMKFCGTCGASGSAREAYQAPAPVYQTPPPPSQPPAREDETKSSPIVTHITEPPLQVTSAQNFDCQIGNQTNLLTCTCENDKIEYQAEIASTQYRCVINGQSKNQQITGQDLTCGALTLSGMTQQTKPKSNISFTAMCGQARALLTFTKTEKGWEKQ